MADFLRQSTAVTVAVGPFLDITDGNTEETGLAITQADVRVSKAGGAFAQKNNATSCSALEHGWYACPLSTTDTNTLGIFVVSIHVSGATFVPQTYMVVAAPFYDAFFTDPNQVIRIN